MRPGSLTAMPWSFALARIPPPLMPMRTRLCGTTRFAFLLAVIFDMGIRAGRAWALPYLLRQRLGYLSPAALIAEPEAVHAAVQQEPKLHRFVNVVPAWLVQVLSGAQDSDEAGVYRH